MLVNKPSAGSSEEHKRRRNQSLPLNSAIAQ